MITVLVGFARDVVFPASIVLLGLLGAAFIYSAAVMMTINICGAA